MRFQRDTKGWGYAHGTRLCAVLGFPASKCPTIDSAVFLFFVLFCFFFVFCFLFFLFIYIGQLFEVNKIPLPSMFIKNPWSVTM